MNASALIAANIAAHSVDGATAWHMVADAHERTIRALAARLAEFEGAGVTDTKHCGHARMTLGDATVLVEFEFEPEDGDGWNLPHTPASFTVNGVLINGAWCDPQDVVPASVIERWEVQLMEDRAEAAQADEAERYEQQQYERAYG